MKLKYYIAFFVYTLIYYPYSFAQSVDPQLVVKQEDEIQSELLLKKLSENSPDTNQVKLLIKASRIYWHKQKTVNKALDTCLSLAQKAYWLSNSLRYSDGSNEATFMMCKVYLTQNNVESASPFLRNSFGEQKVRLLLILAEHFILDLNTEPADLEKAYFLIQQASILSKKIKSDRCLNQCQILLGKYYFSKKEIVNAKNVLLKNIRVQHRAKDHNAEANNWSALAHFIPENEDSYRFIIYCHEMAINNYFKAGKTKDASFELRDLATVNTNHNRIDVAGKQFQQAITVLEAIHEKVPRRHYYLLAEYFRFTGHYYQALRFGIIALRTPEAYDEKRMMVYRSLGETYAALGEYQNSLKYYKVLLDYQLDKNNGRLAYASVYRMAHIEGESGKPKQALAFLTRYINAHPPQNLNQKQLFTSTYGDLYRLIGEYEKAEAHYKEMLALNNSVKLENGKNLYGHEITIEGSGTLYFMGRFYAERKRFQEAKTFLKKSLVNPSYFDAEQESDTYKLLFKADSALGNYLPAIKSFERHKLMVDSMNSITRNNQIAELSIRYQTEQRKKDIKFLESKQKTQLAEIRRAGTVRNVILGGAAAILGLAVFVFIAYRSKQQSNKVLFKQREEINLQNAELQNLLSEKEVFLKEKDWLLKEIHHRVKNNLQIVMSLLSTQSFYMQNDLAKEAILQSENRVQSIALIHQKLYTGDNLATINMRDYINDLVIHLAESFATRRRHITFLQQIENLNIDLSQAVPIGLILNEAITNSIKYAFYNTGGEISIVLKRSSADYIEIKISDNGKGLPADFDIRAANSLGMEMMRGLSAQLKGSLDVSNKSGTAILIRFPVLTKPNLT